MMWLERLFASVTGTPHGQCLLWRSELIALHAISDALIALAYVSIPLTIYLFMRQKRDVENPQLFWLFAAFILSCALTHVMGVWVIWQPHYYLQGAIMALTALISLSAALVLWQQMPVLIKLPSTQTLRAINEELANEVERRKEAEASLREANRRMEALNASLKQRIAEELKKNREKDMLLMQQARLAAMGEMIGNIAHQWRQPINALNLLLANIEDAYQYGELTSEYLQRQVAKGNELIQNMSTTIDDFRNFFKPESAQELFDVRQAVQQALSIVEASLRNHDITLRVNLPDHAVRVHGFPGQYRQVLLNLLGNAKNAILERQRRPGWIDITLEERDQHVVLTVRDNGGGIDPAIIERIFEPYFTTSAHGNGIGLYMSKMIIENNMKGQLRAANDEEGAVFTVILPAAAPHAA